MPLRLIIAMAVAGILGASALAQEHDDAWRAQVIKPRNPLEAKNCHVLQRRIKAMDRTIEFHCEGD